MLASSSLNASAPNLQPKTIGYGTAGSFAAGDVAPW
jgi:hypothetical protein